MTDTTINEPDYSQDVLVVMAREIAGRKAETREGQNAADLDGCVVLAQAVATGNTPLRQEVDRALGLKPSGSTSQQWVNLGRIAGLPTHGHTSPLTITDSQCETAKPWNNGLSGAKHRLHLGVNTVPGSGVQGWLGLIRKWQKQQVEIAAANGNQITAVEALDAVISTSGDQCGVLAVIQEDLNSFEAPVTALQNLIPNTGSLQALITRLESGEGSGDVNLQHVLATKADALGAALAQARDAIAQM